MAEGFQGNRQQALTIDRVTRESRFFLNDFVHGMFEEDGIQDDTPAMEVLQEAEAPGDLPPEHVIEIKRAIKDIIDAQEQEQEKLNSLISQVPPGREKEVTMNIARRLFADGTFNWGRVIGLFYVAYKVCKTVANIVGVFRSLIDTVIDFMRENVISWIFLQGGWDGLRDFVRRKWNYKVLFGGMFAVAAGYIIYKNWNQ